jgi:hypothetical protein
MSIPSVIITRVIGRDINKRILDCKPMFVKLLTDKKSLLKIPKKIIPTINIIATPGIR